VILSAEFELESDQPEAIVKRLRRTWILRKARQPLSFQACCRAFKDPRGMSATGLITQAGLAGTTVGGAEVSDRDANFIIANTGANARDILALIDLIRSRVHERSGIDMELEIAVW
jgi:UDP-N-acetylmuramate dehydrogenase